MGIMPQILVIDDNRQDADLVQEACADSGLSAVFHVALDAKQAKTVLERLQNQNVDIDLIILDLFMPGEDGFEILGTLQHADANRTPRILVLTGSSSMDDVDKSFRLGADFFLWKPTMYDDYRVVAQRIAELLNAPPEPVDPVTGLMVNEEHVWATNFPGKCEGLGG